jgi:hypothetical protein
MRVTALNPSYAESEPKRYAFDQPKYLIYEGEPAPVPTWAAKGSIALTTTNPNYPVRLIDVTMIVSTDNGVVEIQRPKIAEEIRTVTVDGSNGKKYVVTITPHGKSCTCTGFEFRHHCKHLNMAV